MRRRAGAEQKRGGCSHKNSLRPLIAPKTETRTHRKKSKNKTRFLIYWAESFQRYKYAINGANFGVYIVVEMTRNARCDQQPPTELGDGSTCALNTSKSGLPRERERVAERHGQQAIKRERERQGVIEREVERASLVASEMGEAKCGEG